MCSVCVWLVCVCVCVCVKCEGVGLTAGLECGTVDAHSFQILDTSINISHL